MAFFARNTLLLSGSASLVLGLGGTAMSETVAAVGTTTLPGITVIRPEQSAQPSRRPKKRAVAQRRRVTTAASPPPTREQSPPPTQEQVSQTQQQVVAGQNEKFDETRRNIDTPIGATSYQVTHQEHRSPAAGHQHGAGQGVVAISWRHAGLRRQRRTSCAQRARQPPVSHQRHHAAGWRRRVRANPRHRHRRQPCPAYRCVAGAVRPAHGRRAGHPDQDGRLQQHWQRQRLRRQPRHHHTQLRIWRHRRTNPVFRVRSLSAKQSGNRKSCTLE